MNGGSRFGVNWEERPRWSDNTPDLYNGENDVEDFTTPSWERRTRTWVRAGDSDKIRLGADGSKVDMKDSSGSYVEFDGPGREYNYRVRNGDADEVYDTSGADLTAQVYGSKGTKMDLGKGSDRLDVQGSSGFNMRDISETAWGGSAYDHHYFEDAHDGSMVLEGDRGHTRVEITGGSTNIGYAAKGRASREVEVTDSKGIEFNFLESSGRNSIKVSGSEVNYAGGKGADGIWFDSKSTGKAFGGDGSDSIRYDGNDGFVNGGRGKDTLEVNGNGNEVIVDGNAATRWSRPERDEIRLSGDGNIIRMTTGESGAPAEATLKSNREGAGKTTIVEGEGTIFLNPREWRPGTEERTWRHRDGHTVEVRGDVEVRPSPRWPW